MPSNNDAYDDLHRFRVSTRIRLSVLLRKLEKLQPLMMIVGVFDDYV